uniref:Uncharacterized protein n=1 Tax=Ignisphaera aggregans TaxID=334771 RepID=A0A7C2V9K9_9CREN
MSEPIKLIVTGSRPEDIVKCTLIASKVRRYVQRYTNIHILFTPNTRGVSGIAIEDEFFVGCEDEEESIERIIDVISRVITRKRFMDVAVAAGMDSR